MRKQELELVREEIRAALSTAVAAGQEGADPDLSAIDADTFKRIARPLRRALRVIEPQRSGGAKLELEVESKYAQDDELEGWKIDGHMYAAMLASRECPPGFRAAFTEIFYQHLLGECDAAHPNYVAAFFPLVVLAMMGNNPVDALSTVAVLRTLRETLAPELVKKIRDEMRLD